MDNNVIHEEIEVDVPHQLHFVHFQLPFALIFLYSFFFSLISLAKWNKNYYTTLHCILGYFNSILVLLSNWLLHFRCITFWFYGSYFLSHALLLVPVYTHTYMLTRCCDSSWHHGGMSTFNISTILPMLKSI